MNYWQAFKWAGQYDQIKAEVDSSDFSAKSPLFQLALATIKDDFELVFKLLPAVLENGHLKTHSLLDWPLFQAVRERPEFATYLPRSEQGNERSQVAPAEEASSLNDGPSGTSAA